MIKGNMFHKGNRVEFNIKGKVKYGTVSKGGRGQIAVVIDGGTHQIKGSALCFQLSQHPFPKDKPSEMDRYSLKGYREIQGQDGRNFNAIILENGKPILRVVNSGNGGCNEYEAIDYKIRFRETEKRFFSAVKLWVTQFGYPDMIEPEDDWVEWHQHERPFGVLAETSIQEIKDMLNEIKSGTKQDA